LFSRARVHPGGSECQRRPPSTFGGVRPPASLLVHRAGLLHHEHYCQSRRSISSQGGGDTKLARAQACGLLLLLAAAARSPLSIEGRRTPEGDWKTRGGLEVRIENHVSLRGGLERIALSLLAPASRATASRSISAWLSIDDLGAYLCFTLR
jgi:hypothetical protein